MKVDPKTAHQIASGQVTAVLRSSRLGATRQPVQFERTRGQDDRAPRHADDTTVLDSKCHVLVTEQREVRLGELTDQDAKRLGYRSLFMLKQAFGDEWRPNARRWWVTVERHDADRPQFMARVSGATESRHLSIDPDAERLPPHVLRDVNARRSKGLGHDAQQELRRRAARVRAAQLRDSETKAIGKGVDISKEVAAIDAYLESIRTKIDEAA